MKLKSLKRKTVEFMVNHLLAGTKFFEMKRRLLISIGYAIGEKTKVVGPLYCTGTLKIGDSCWIGRNLTVHGNGSVNIGDRCDIAPDVVFITGGHQIGDNARRAGQGEHYCITIGNGVWLGARATILMNTTVADGCVVAACACVNKSVLSNMLVAGVPARIVRNLESEDYNAKVDKK